MILSTVPLEVSNLCAWSSFYQTSIGWCDVELKIASLILDHPVSLRGGWNFPQEKGTPQFPTYPTGIFKINMEPENRPLERKIICQTKPSFSGSMLIFGGVYIYIYIFFCGTVYILHSFVYPRNWRSHGAKKVTS